MIQEIPFELAHTRTRSLSPFPSFLMWPFVSVIPFYSWMYRNLHTQVVNSLFRLSCCRVCCNSQVSAVSSLSSVHVTHYSQQVQQLYLWTAEHWTLNIEQVVTTNVTIQWTMDNGQWSKMYHGNSPLTKCPLSLQTFSPSLPLFIPLFSSPVCMTL